MECQFKLILERGRNLKSAVNSLISKKPLERVQADLVKIPDYMKCSQKYLMTVKDHFSRFAYVYFFVH